MLGEPFRAMQRIAIAIALTLTACGSGETPASSAGHQRGPFAAAPATATPPTSVARPSRPHRDLDTFDHGSLSPSSAGAITETTTTSSSGGTAAGPEERHLGDELATAIGSPASCLDLETARSLHGRLSVSVSATVMATGGVTRATASGASLPETVLTCLQARALAAHLRAPVEGAPRTVSTTLAFDVTATDDRTTTTTPEWHQPGAVAEPGHVLPAVGAQGRPEGALAPDSTLPAIGARGRPEGSVSPDIVTPARGGGGTIWPSDP